MHTASFGIVVGCLSLAGRRTGQLPDPLTAAGLAAAAAGVLSPLSLVVKPAVWLIPAGRMSGLAVTGAAGVLLSRSRATSPRVRAVSMSRGVSRGSPGRADEFSRPGRY